MKPFYKYSIINRFYDEFKRILNTILNLLFPFSEIRRKIESLTAEEILEKCEKAEINDDKIRCQFLVMKIN